jgi:bifunctional non-homologous end joining protein LigD
MLQRALPAGFIAPCLPTKTDKLPSGGQWLHEIKHDGFRIIARKNGPRVRLYSRPGNDLTRRFPLDDCQACQFGQAGKERRDVAR